MPEQATPEGGEGASASKTPMGFTEEQNAQIEKIVLRRLGEKEKQLEPELQKAKQFDELQKKIEEQRKNELTEIEKLQAQVSELLPIKETASKYETTLKSILEKRIESIPELKRKLVPLTLSDTDKLEWIETNWDYLSESNGHISSPAGGKHASGSQDPIQVRAEQMLDEIYPPSHYFRKRDDWEAIKKERLARFVEQLKLSPEFKTKER